MRKDGRPRRDGLEIRNRLYDRDDVDDHARRQCGRYQNLAFSAQLHVAQEPSRKRTQEYVRNTIRCCVP